MRDDDSTVQTILYEKHDCGCMIALMQNSGGTEWLEWAECPAHKNVPALLAEVERLQAEHNSHAVVLATQRHVAELEAENERLRAALELFATSDRWGDDGTTVYEFFSQGEAPDVFARRTLQGEKPA